MKHLYRLSQNSRSSSSYSKIQDAHLLKKPSILSGSLSGTLWRHKSMGMTLKCLTDPEILEQLRSRAVFNLKSWSIEKTQPPHKVEVVNQDWGEATLAATKKHGKLYSVLNMANSLYPGGGALEGGSAQEENMWHRTSCPLSLLSKGIYFDETTNDFLYNDEIRQLLRAQKQMSPEELEELGHLREEKITEAYKIFVNEQQEVCFRGPEILVPTDFENIGVMRGGYYADSGMSFSFLPEEKIFPFYEVRSAAPELATHTDVNWNDDKFLRDYINEVRRRIGAQLDTLIIRQEPHAILGAWGCGSFKNNPQIIAKIYREEIEKRANYFDHIVFPIIDTNSTYNFEIFGETLDGLKLGNPKKQPSEKLPNPHVFYAPGSNKPTDSLEDKPKKESGNSP